MFCPKCYAEYRDGFDHCSDCDIPLVNQLPPESKPEFIDYEEVLGTYNPADIAYIKCILNAENITYFIHGEHFSYIRPLVDPARLMVSKDQVETVKEILKDVKLSRVGINLSESNSEKKLR